MESALGKNITEKTKKKANTKNKVWQIIGVAVLCALCVLGAVLGVVFGMNHSTEDLNVSMAISSESTYGEIEKAPLLAQSASSGKMLKVTDELHHNISDDIASDGSSKFELLQKIEEYSGSIFSYQLRFLPTINSGSDLQDSLEQSFSLFQENSVLRFESDELVFCIKFASTNLSMSTFSQGLFDSFDWHKSGDGLFLIEINQDSINFKVDETEFTFAYLVGTDAVDGSTFYNAFIENFSEIYAVLDSDENVISGDFFDCDLSSVEEVFTVYEEVEQIELPPNPTKDGYTFTGWFYDEACTKPYDNEPIYSDTKLYAGWRINTFKVTFDSDGGSAVDEQTVDWNTSATLTTPTKEGYTFVGWFLPSGTQYTNQAIKADTTLTARWSINKITVKFDTDGGNTIANATIDWNTAVKTGVPTKEGYDFKGWYLADGTLYTNQALKADTTLKAKWQIKRLTIKFDSNGGDKVDGAEIDWNTAVAIPTTPTRIGYNFVGWFLPDNTEYTGQVLKSSCTITAKWQIKTYKITFIVDGEVYDEVTVDHGTRLGEIANQVGVYEQNVYAYRCESFTEPTEELGDMTIVDDMTVLANKADEKDTVWGEIKNNWLPIVLGVVGGIALISLLSVIIKKSKKKA